MFLIDELMPHLQPIIEKRVPNEAVGLILPNGQVVELLNHAYDPSTAFAVKGKDIQDVFVAYKLPLTRDTIRDSVLWHSHPGGNIGPSRTDMKNKLELMQHLVLSVIDGEIVASWY